MNIDINSVVQLVIAITGLVTAIGAVWHSKNTRAKCEDQPPYKRPVIERRINDPSSQS